MQGYIVAGIGTEVGKTLVSAILVEAWGADYWKPVQAGDLAQSDSHKIQQWTSPPKVVHPEGFRLQTPMSPHAAAEIDQIEIQQAHFTLPSTQNLLNIEMAGGLMVPLNEKLLFLDLLEVWQLPIVLVSRYYLGSINHTLLSVEVLKARKLPILGLVMNGTPVSSSRSIILSQTGLPVLAEIPEAQELNADFVRQQAQQIDAFPL